MHPSANPPAPARLPNFQPARLLAWLAAAVAVISLAVLLAVALLRMFYPYELEWSEGASLDQIRWIAQGGRLYGEPSLSFLPLIYNPLYFFLSAGLVKLFGGGFVAPRLLSILATAGTLWLLYDLTTRDTGQRLSGFLAAGLYAAAYRFAGAWMDLAKTDSLVVFLILAGFAAGRRWPGRRGQAASGLLYVAAYFTKQLALPIVAILAAISLAESRGRTWRLWLATALAGLAVTWILDATSAGWYSFYVVRAVTYEQRVTDFGYFWRTLAASWWPSLPAGVLVAALAWRQRADGWPRSLWPNLGLAAALLLGSWSVFFKVWIYANNFMAACAALALLAGLGHGWARRTAGPASGWAGASSLLLLGQVAVLAYNPLAQLPTAQDRAAAAEFVERIRGLPGEVLVFNHGYVNALAGKPPYLHSAQFGDMLSAASQSWNEADRQRSEQVRRMFRQGVERQAWNWVILDQPNKAWTPYYLYVDNVFDDPGVLYPVTGAGSRPESLTIKNPVARGGVFPLADETYAFLLDSGWGPPEPWGRWAAGPRAGVQAALEAGHDYQIRLQVFAASCGDGAAGPVMRVEWNGQALGEHRFESCERQSLLFSLPASAVAEGLNSLQFAFEAAPGSPPLPPGQPVVAFASLVFFQQP